MFLKKLDIVGFKSFADRVSVEFVDGVTAVVGPNGSGKSNITDGIRWVLGEQSVKSLRGGKMEDVIFSGSDSRKSLNFAEVTLTLNNERQQLPIEYNEVSVTRRVYRSGDSEFYINKQACRLKDIVELFMDSGLGREAFSIIGQGKVEEILNSKPDERRAIFEEAAGVLKYKTRKRKAEQKIHETQDNLNRVRDILHELENQVEPLKIQASIAKDYLEKKAELKSFDVACIVYEIEQLHQEWEQRKQAFTILQEKEVGLSARLKSKEAVTEKLRDEITALDDSVNDLQNVLLAASEELEKLEGRKQVLIERKKNAVNNEEQLAKNLEETKEKISRLSAQEASLSEKVSKDEQEAAEFKQLLQEKQQEMKGLSENIEDTIESLKADYIEGLNKQAAARNELQHLGQQLEQLAARKNRIHSENEKHLKERTAIEEEKKKKQNALAAAEEELTEHIHRFREQQQKNEALKAKLAKQESNLYQAYQILQEAKSRKNMLETLEEDYSGFFQGVKEILKAREQLDGIEGAVAEIIEVPKEYETALEIALGGSMQHIITRNEESARAAIAFLKQHRFGRATFLPLSAMKGKSLPSAILAQLETDEAFIGVASDLVHFDAKYSQAINNLLGNVIITADLAGANQLAKKLNYRFRLVTLEGDVVNPGGSMTGGALKQKASSLLSRKNELEALRNKLVNMEEKTAVVEREVKKLKETITDNERTIDNMRVQGDEFRKREQEWKNELMEWEFSFKTINDRLSLYDKEQEEYIREENKLSSRQSEVTKTLAAKQLEIEDLDNEIKVLTEKKQQERFQREQILNDISDAKSKLAVKNEQLISGKKLLIQVQADLKDTKKRNRQWKDDLVWLKSEMSSSNQGEEELDKAARKKSLDKQESAKLISLRREERMDKQKLLEDEEMALKEARRQHKGMLEAGQDEEVKINRLDVELENRLEQLSNEYELTFEAAKQSHPLPFAIEEVRRQIRLIKLAIDELGQVNLGAIEEYERLSERYSFLQEQRIDLQEAKDTLSQVILEMDEEMTKRFKETFQAIQAQFLPVFQSLFGGGKAELKLTSPGDLLNTGVDIIAQPPGKKLQNLSLLSGGERALTAIALLFSILKVRPVPFCVLDEVEAALDEANVFRFSQYLKQFSKDTQFIVITHRKGTMEEADVLYGITMQESGVSKLVSVRMEETKQLAKA